MADDETTKGREDAEEYDAKAALGEKYEATKAALEEAGTLPGGVLADAIESYEGTADATEWPSGILDDLKAVGREDPDAPFELLPPVDYLATTSQMRRIIEDTARQGFNRQAPEGIEKQLSRSAKHALAPMLEHHHINGVRTDIPHIRCQVHVRLVGYRSETFMLDVDQRLLDRLQKDWEYKPKAAGPEPFWHELLEIQAQTAKAYLSSYGEGAVAGIHATVGMLDDTATPQENPRLFASGEAVRLRRAEPFWVTKDMTTLLEAAAPSMPSYTLNPVDLPSPSGFVWFERLVEIPGAAESDEPARLRAICWGYTGVVTPENETVPGILLTCYADRQADTQWQNPQLMSALDEARFGRILVAWVAPWRMGQRADEPRAKERWYETVLAIRKFFAAFILISGQRLAMHSYVRPPRAFVKRAKRQEMAVSEVRVITLRRATTHVEGGEPTHIEWSHRWLVSGHWRHLWKEDEQRTKLIWVSPYIKGPEDKPFIAKRNVFKLER
jgi:hypothetical protein